MGGVVSPHDRTRHGLRNPAEPIASHKPRHPHLIDARIRPILPMGVIFPECDMPPAAAAIRGVRKKEPRS